MVKKCFFFLRKYSLLVFNLRDTRITLFRLKLFGKVSFIIAQLKLASCRYNQDSPRTCKRMNETRKIEDSADEPSNERKNDADNRDAENVKSEKTTPNADSHTYQLVTMLSPPDCRSSKEVPSNVSDLNLGKFILEKY